MNDNSKNVVLQACAAGLKGIALFVVICAAIALAGLAVGIVLAAASVLLLLLIFALIVNPGEVKALIKIIGDRVGEVLSRIEALVASMRDIIGEMSAAARAATGATIHQQENRQTETEGGVPHDSQRQVQDKISG